mmetsp:Transcript_34615/g.112611  ORF Transcript_34615/g.112611 Transcript_34615/m.112611 type:complete len:515 (-) Transcript_34615:404-1948(-)
MIVEGREVLLRLLAGAGSQTLVVLALPACPLVVLLLPCLVFRDREERVALGAPCHFHDRRHKLLQEAGKLQERREPVLHPVDDESLDVGTVKILIGHDHDGAIPQALGVCVLLGGVKCHDLHELLNLPVFHHLLDGEVAHIPQLTAQREHAVGVASDHGQTCHCEGLGRISLREDEGAARTFLRAGFVGVLELRDAEEPLLHAEVALVEVLCELALAHRFRPLLQGIQKTALQHLVDEVLGELALGAEAFPLARQRLFGLRVEGRVLNEAVHEDPEVAFHMLRLHGQAPLHLPSLLHDSMHDLVADMVDVRATAGRVDRIDETHLLEAAAVSESDGDLPPVVDDLAHAEGIRRQVKPDIIPEGVHLEQLAVEVDLAAAVRGGGHVVGAAPHDAGDVGLQGGHGEALEVGVEGDLREVRGLALDGLDGGRVALGHVVLPNLFVRLLRVRVRGLDDELGGENVGKLGSVSVAAARDLALAVVVIVAGQELAENKLGNEAVMFAVLLHWQALPVVPH